MTAAETTARDAKRSDVRLVRVGSYYSRHSFGTVVGDLRATAGTLKLRNENGYEWEIGADILEREFSFADQHDRTETLSRTDLLKVLNAAPRTAMTVNFHKKAEPKDVAEKLRAGQGEKTLKAWRDEIEAAVVGEERTMIGHHHGGYDEHGRLQFVEAGKGMRTIDPRTINWLVCGRARYEVRG